MTSGEPPDQPPEPPPPDQPPASSPSPPEPPPAEQAPPPPPPSPPTDPNALPPMAPKSGMSGCAKAAIIGGVILLVLVVAAGAFFFWGVSRFVDSVEDVASPDSCELISDEDASHAVEAEVTVESGRSIFGSVLGIIRDTRLLASAPNCFVSSEDGSYAAWISVYDGSDAAEVFAGAADIADGEVVSSTSIAGGSIQVETSPFRGPDVPGLGDEAFCTELGVVISGGVLAREGNRVVYVSMMPSGDSQDPFGGDTCARAVPLARALLARS